MGVLYIVIVGVPAAPGLVVFPFERVCLGFPRAMRRRVAILAMTARVSTDRLAWPGVATTCDAGSSICS